MEITAAMVRELRQMTDAPMMDCKKALAEAGGDVQAAVEVLRKRGITKAAKKAGREMTEGLVGSYIHTNGKVGVLVELSCETDFCARNEAFQQFLKDICMHVAAADPAPIAVRVEDIPEEILEAEKKIYEEQARQSGKPEQFWPKIIDGRLAKFKSERALLEQPFIKNPDLTVGDLLKELVGKLGENISIRRFQKFRVGE